MTYKKGDIVKITKYESKHYNKKAQIFLLGSDGCNVKILNEEDLPPGVYTSNKYIYFRYYDIEKVIKED